MLMRLKPYHSLFILAQVLVSKDTNVDQVCVFLAVASVFDWCGNAQIPESFVTLNMDIALRMSFFLTIKT